jgi:3-hydroxyacyl-[acyl-carrier-protein] dehydratase
MPLATFEGSIRVGQDKAAVAEEVTLTFAYADEATQMIGARDDAAASAPTRSRDAAGGQPPLAAAAVAAS